jgi:hypothetical protein
MSHRVTHHPPVEITDALRHRFWSKVRPAANGCWEWQASFGSHGYGQLTVGSKTDGTKRPELAHRISYMLVHGEPLGAWHVLHSCDNRRCVKPGHLSLGTHADNMADALAKGRTQRGRGESHSQARLTEPDVLAIRERHGAGERVASLSREYGLTPSGVQGIVERRTWKHV